MACGVVVRPKTLALRGRGSSPAFDFFFYEWDPFFSYIYLFDESRYRDAPSVVGNEESFKYFVSYSYKQQEPILAKSKGKYGK